MNSKTNSTAIAPAIIAAAQIHGLQQPVVPIVFATPVLSENVITWPRFGFRCAGLGADPRAGEFWETLSCVALWLCGWIAIGLCFL